MSSSRREPIRIPFEIITEMGEGEATDASTKQFSEDALTTVLEKITGMEADELSRAVKSASKIQKSPVQNLTKLTADQISNVTTFAKNPGMFIFGTVLKKFAKGAGILALALVIQAAVKMVLDGLLRPGGIWDRRFRRLIQSEILAFQSREFKHMLRQGFRSVIVTSSPGLRITPGGPTGTVSYSRDFVGTQAMEATIPFNLNAVMFNASEDTKGMRSHNGGIYFGRSRG